MKRIYLLLLSIVLISLFFNSQKVFAQSCLSDSDCVYYCQSQNSYCYYGTCVCPQSSGYCSSHNQCWSSYSVGCCLGQCNLATNRCSSVPFSYPNDYSSYGQTPCPASRPTCGNDCQCYAATTTTTTTTTTTQPQCAEGNYRCVGSNLERCTNGAWAFVQSCSSGCLTDHCISPTSTTTTTTTTTPPPEQFQIKCDICFSNSTCKCSIIGNCNQGFWILKNLEGSPISETIENIPPNILSFTPTSTGKINITATCSIPQIPSKWTVVNVEPEILQCPSTCQANIECKCDVRGCNAGVFSVENVEGNSISGSVSSPMYSSPFSGKFTPIGLGKSKVTVNCVNPSIITFKYVTTEGTITTTTTIFPTTTTSTTTSTTSTTTTTTTTTTSTSTTTTTTIPIYGPSKESAFGVGIRVIAVIAVVALISIFVYSKL